MKQIVITSLLIVICVASGWAQKLTDKVYFDEDWNVISNASEASYYRLYNAKDKSTGLKPYQDYYINGRLQGEGFYSHIENDGGNLIFIEEGEQKNYYDNGKLHEKWYKKNGEIDGEDISYYESGMKEWVLIYKNDIIQKATKYDDSTGTIDRVLTYKNGELDGKQIQYVPFDRNEVWKEEFFNNGLMQKEIGYVDGKVRKIFTLISRTDSNFVANETWFYREDEDSLVGKKSVDMVYDFDPEIWRYAFQMYYVETANFNNAISEYHGKYQSFDRQNRILIDGQYFNGGKTGKWTNYLYDQNCYYIDDYDDINAVRHYYQLNNKPFSGLVTIPEPADGKTELNIKNGIHCGKYTVYRYDNGELFMKYYGNFDENGKEDGYFHGDVEFNGEWKTVDYSNFKHGVKHGEWREIQGDSIIFKNYNNGKLDGKVKIITVNSRDEFALPEDSLWHIITNGHYTNGSRSGHWWKVTDRQWEQEQMEGNYENDEREGEWTFYTSYTPDGYIAMRQIDAIANYHNGKLHGKLTQFKNKTNAPFKDSINTITYFKDGMQHGSYEKHDNDGNIIVKGNYLNDERVGVWTYKYFDENCYLIVNNDDESVPDRFYTLNGKPFTGTHTQQHEKNDDDDYDKIVITIQKSLIQQVEFIDSATGKVVHVNKYKNGLPIE